MYKFEDFKDFINSTDVNTNLMLLKMLKKTIKLEECSLEQLLTISLDINKNFIHWTIQEEKVKYLSSINDIVKTYNNVLVWATYNNILNERKQKV